MKKVLVITYYWPPSGGSGVQRWMYFCNYLSDFGYEPIVLTVSEKYASYKNEDLSFLEFVKDIKVHKTKSFEPLKLYSKLTTGDSKKGIPMGSVGTNKKGILQKLSLFVRGNFFVPDARVGWNKYALKEAKKIINSENIELVITTGPPNSSHLIGLELKKSIAIKWLADFRDPWTDIYYNKLFNRGGRAEEKDKKYELSVLENADKITTIGVKLQELLQAKLKQNNQKFDYLYNGFDAHAMNELIKNKHDHFEITFIGLLTKSQPYQSIVEVLKKMHSNNPNSNIVFCLAGNIDNDILLELQNELPFIQFKLEGYIDHKKALYLMKQSDLLLNFLSEMENSEILISGKQMEYLATGNPTLCIGNTKGECAMLLENIENAQIFEKTQQSEILSFVTRVFEMWQKGESFQLSTDNDYIKSKSRYEVTRKLASILDTM